MPVLTHLGHDLHIRWRVASYEEVIPGGEQCCNGFDLPGRERGQQCEQPIHVCTSIPEQGRRGIHLSCRVWAERVTDLAARQLARGEQALLVCNALGLVKTRIERPGRAARVVSAEERQRRLPRGKGLS